MPKKPEQEPQKEPVNPISLLQDIRDLIKSSVKSLMRIARYPPEMALKAYPSTAVTVATPAKPANPDILAGGGNPGYDRINIYIDEPNRISDKIWVICDGPASLFVVTTYDDHIYSGEDEIKPHEARCFTSVFELRVRSPSASTTYRITEYEPKLCCYTPGGGGLAPIQMALIQNTAVLANTNFLATDITPVNTPTTFKIMVAMDTLGTLTARITNGGNTQTVTFNVVAGPSLVAGGLYTFIMLVHAGDTVNFRYSVNATIQVLRVQEIDAATA